MTTTGTKFGRLLGLAAKPNAVFGTFHFLQNRFPHSI
jgi:hypothetical protein